MNKILLSIIALSFIACSSNKSQHSSINSVNVTEQLEKTPEGDMWAYNRHSNESQSLGGSISHYAWTGWTALSGMRTGGDQSTSSTKNVSLVLYFGKNKVLQNYSFRTERF